MSNPLDQLLRLGSLVQRPRVNYTALGLTAAHIPALLRMLKDDALWESESEPETWAVLHIIRALGDLRAVEAIPALIGLFNIKEDDFTPGEAVQALGQIGSAALPALRPVLFARLNSLEMRVSASDAIGRIGENHPAARPECVAALAAQLRQFAITDPAINGWVISDLMDLKAVEAAEVIEAAFAGGYVALDVCGDWEDAQVELGLLAERRTPRPRYIHKLH